MKSLLPVFRSDQEYHACNHTEEMYLPAMREVCAKHDISNSKLTRFEEGESAIVFSIDNELLPVPEWAEFVRQQCAACQDHQARGGVHESLVEQVLSFMEAYLPDPNAVTCSAILHTELTREAWYIEQANGSWILSGLFDFGDVLIGDPRADCLWREFDLSLLRSYLAAYDYEDGVFADANLLEKVTFDFFGNWTHWRGHRKTWLVRLKANYQFTKKVGSRLYVERVDEQLLKEVSYNFNWVLDYEFTSESHFYFVLVHDQRSRRGMFAKLAYLFDSNVLARR